MAMSERWIAIAAHDDGQWQRLVECMGEPSWACEPHWGSLAERLEHGDELDAAIGRWTREQDAEGLMETLQAAGVEAGVVRDFAQLQSDPQLAAREHFVRVQHAPLGELAFERSGSRLSATPGRISRPGPLLGEHSRAILSGILGLSDAEIQALIAGGVNV